MTGRSVLRPLAAVRAAGLRAWRSLRTTRQRVEAGVAFTAAVACIVAAGLQVGPALAETTIEGEPVPDDVLAAIVVGATSCPSLTGPRLAGQLMAASELKANAVTADGEGLAAMSAEEWKKWAPWPQAQRSDVRANVLAVAHQTCETIGRMRAAKVDGDLWEAAVAAERVGADAVAKAKGVPDEAREHVDTVVGYTNWYAEQPAFTGEDPADAPVEASASAPAGVSIPEEYLPAIRKAGAVCPAVVSPAHIAAQLMAVSSFNPNLKGPGGRSGIAQFDDDLWRQYRPTKSASVWDPQAAIPALGTAMCDLKNQLSAVKQKDGKKTDPYDLALAAFQWGVTAVRAEGGIPDGAAVGQLTDQVMGFLAVYTGDTRLSDEKPAASPSPSRSSSPSPSPSLSPSPEAEAEESSEAPAPEPTPTRASEPGTVWDPAVSYQFVNSFNGRVIEVPGDDNVTAGGTTIQLWDNLRARDQYWHIANAADGYVVITNAFNNKALGIRDAATDNGAELVMLDPAFADTNQQWKLLDGGAGRYFLQNRKTGKVLDVHGDDCCGVNGTPVTQWDQQDYAVDQHWTLAK